MAVLNGRTGFPYHFPYTQVAADGTWPEYDAVCTYKEQSENMLQDDPDFPFYLTTGRVAHYHHTTLRTAPYSRELIPVPDMRINPRDAAALGVAHGDWVELSSRRGATRGLPHRGRASRRGDDGAFLLPRKLRPFHQDHERRLAPVQREPHGPR